MKQHRDGGLGETGGWVARGLERAAPLLLLFFLLMGIFGPARADDQDRDAGDLDEEVNEELRRWDVLRGGLSPEPRPSGGALQPGTDRWTPAEQGEGRFRGEGDCVVDSTTGLMWPRDGNPVRSLKNWYQAIGYCESLTLCGYHDWRLPTMSEMESIVNPDEPDSAQWLNARGFERVASGYYWTSSVYDINPAFAWVVYMRFGYSGYHEKGYLNYVFPVRDWVPRK